MKKYDVSRYAELSLKFADLKLEDIPAYKELSDDAKNLLRVICAATVVCKVTDLVVKSLEELMNERHN